ncbi:MAG: flippase-like domain-containing protein, partial [Bacteroidales bacterium]|nr:flippase-like domain-containing protein [Bacteroidales bacterium]
MAKIRINKYIKLFLKLAFTVGALYFVFTKINFHDVLSLYRSSNFIVLIGALLVFAFSKAIAAFRLNQFLKCIFVNISEKSNLRLYLLGMFYNLFLPGGIGGDGYKIYLLNKKFSVKVKKIFSAILLDRISGVLALFCLAVILSYFIYYPVIYKYFTWFLVPLSILIFYLIIKYFFKDYLNIFFKTNFQSFIVQISQTISALMILYALGINDNTTGYLFIFLISSIVAILPITIGGVGSREITFLFGARLIDLDVNNSIALSLMFYLITAIVSLSGIYYSIKPPQ